MKSKTILHLFCVVTIGLFMTCILQHIEVKAITRDDAIEWLRSQDNRNIDWCDCDGNDPSCVDLATAWMNYLWFNTNGYYKEPWCIYYGEAYSTRMGYKYDTYAAEDPFYWDVIAREDNPIPEPGDIFVSEANPDNNYTGHVGIILEVDGSIGANIIEMHPGVAPHIEYHVWGSGSYTAEHFVRFTRYDQSIKEYYIDLNWFIDSEEVDHTDPRTPGTVDVYINGKCVKKSATDFYEKFPVGTEFEFKNLTTTSQDCIYVGVKGDVKGKVHGDIKVNYMYQTKKKENVKPTDSPTYTPTDSPKDSKGWIETKKGTYYYWDIPSGFDTKHELYTKYNRFPLKSYEDSKEKTIASDPKITGYIYYHWTSNYSERSNYNVYISEEYKIDGSREYGNFRAFFSAEDYGHTDINGIYGGDNVYYTWDNNPLDGSWWWFRVPIYEQTWITYISSDGLSLEDLKSDNGDISQMKGDLGSNEEKNLTPVPTQVIEPIPTPKLNEETSAIPTQTEVVPTPTPVQDVTLEPTHTEITPVISPEPTYTESGDIENVKINSIINDGFLKYKVKSTGKVSVTGRLYGAESVIIFDEVYIDGVKYEVVGIEKNAFKNDKTLFSLTIMGNLEYIGAKAFAACTSLQKLYIVGNVKKINSKAFYKCKALETINIGTSAIKKIYSKAFAGINKNVNVFVPRDVLDKYKKLLEKGKLPPTAKISA